MTTDRQSAIPAGGRPASAALEPDPGAQRIVARYGRLFEEFRVGDVYEHRPGRTITETDNIHFSLLTMNRHPLHCDAAWAAGSEFGRPLVNSTLTLAVVTGLSVDDVSGCAIANLGWREVRLPAPVYAGDTLYARSKVVAARLSRSRPDAGIVTVLTEGYNQHGTVVIRFERQILVPRRGHETERGGPARSGSAKGGPT